MFLSEWREFPSAPCLSGKETDDSSHLDFVEIARVPDMLPSLFLSCWGWGRISTPIAPLLLNLGTQWVWVVSISFQLIFPWAESSLYPVIRKLKKKESFLAHSQNCETRLLATSCLSVRSHGTSRLPLDEFSWNFVPEYFAKICRKIQVSLKSDYINNG